MTARPDEVAGIKPGPHPSNFRRLGLLGGSPTMADKEIDAMTIKQYRDAVGRWGNPSQSVADINDDVRHVDAAMRKKVFEDLAKACKAQAEWIAVEYADEISSDPLVIECTASTARTLD